MQFFCNLKQLKRETFIERFIPILSLFKKYTPTIFKADLMAGILVAVLLIPQSIAYAFLAGMPPQYGLYTAVIPLLLYSIFGRSPHIAIGPVAVSALLVLAGISKVVEPFTPEYVELVILTGLCVGFLQLLLGFLKMGFLLKFMTHPVVTGFTSAASIIIIIAQLETVVGIDSDTSESLLFKLKSLILGCREMHIPSALLSLATGVIIYFSKKYKTKIPSGLIVVFLGILFSYLLDFEGKGIELIGAVPSGLPSFMVPGISLAKLLKILPTILIVTLIGIIEAMAIIRAMEFKNNETDNEKYIIDTNQELVALGISKLGGAFFQAIPSSGSFSRSALLYDSKGKTTLSSLFTVVLVIVALYTLTSSLYFLPKVILAVIIIYAVKKLFEWSTAKKYYKFDRQSLFIMGVTFFNTLFINIEVGVVLGILTSFLMSYRKTD